MSVPVQAFGDFLAYAPGLKIDSTIKADGLADGSYQRLADGAYGDNTSAAGVLRNLQDDNAAGFNLVVSDDAVAGGPVQTEAGSFGMGESAAQLFGYESNNGLAKECFSTNYPCLEKPSPQVFAKDVALSKSPD